MIKFLRRIFHFALVKYGCRGVKNITGRNYKKYQPRPLDTVLAKFMKNDDSLMKFLDFLKNFL